MNFFLIQILLLTLTFLFGKVLAVSPLVQAAQDGDLKTIERLLTSDINAPMVEYSKALIESIKNNHLSVAERLLQDNRVDPSADDNYAIQWASYYGHSAIVTFLLEDPRVDPSASNNYAIRWASDNGHSAVVALLLKDNRVNPSADNNYAIEWASQNGHSAVVVLLLRNQRVRSKLLMEPKLKSKISSNPSVYLSIYARMQCKNTNIALDSFLCRGFVHSVTADRSSSNGYFKRILSNLVANFIWNKKRNSKNQRLASRLKTLWQNGFFLLAFTEIETYWNTLIWMMRRRVIDFKYHPDRMMNRIAKELEIDDSN